MVETSITTYNSISQDSTHQSFLFAAVFLDVMQCSPGAMFGEVPKDSCKDYSPVQCHQDLL